MFEIMNVVLSKISTPCLTTILGRNFTSTSFLNRHPGIIYPQGFSRQWAVAKVMDPTQYTVEAVPIVRTGGRGPDGVIKLKHVTSGLRRPWFMVDYNHSRHLKTGQIHAELVLEIKKNWWRHPFIALVASGEVKRWIVATANVKVGDVIHSHVDIPIISVDAKVGDIYPIGALPTGTTVSQIELKPGEGALRCRTAGSSATIIRRGKLVGSKSVQELSSLEFGTELNDEEVVIVRNDGNRKLLRLLPSCMAVVGQVSNIEHAEQKYSKFGEKYWHGIKQRSGLRQRKTGRFGRKIRPIGPPEDFIAPPKPTSHFTLHCTLPGESKFDRNKRHQLFKDLDAYTKKKIQPEPKSNCVSNSLPRFRWCSWSSVR